MRRNSAAMTLPPLENGSAAAPVYGRSPFRVGDPLPGVLYLGDLAAILELSYGRATHLQAANEFVIFEMRPRVGGTARYSGKKVQAWLDGEAESTQRYFKSAR
jgi:hypothetical protein